MASVNDSASDIVTLLTVDKTGSNIVTMLTLDKTVYMFAGKGMCR